MNMIKYRPGCSADQAHLALTQSVKTIEQAQHCAVLWFTDIRQRKLYRELGFSSMNQYASEKLGFSRSRTGDFMMLAKRLDGLPAVKEELASGRMGYTIAREIVPVADAANEKDWLAVARNQSRRQLENTVRQAKAEAKKLRKSNPAQNELMSAPVSVAPPAVVPMRVGFELTPSQYARYETLLAKIGHQRDKAELLLEMMENFLATAAEMSPRGEPAPPYQIHVHDCPECGKTTVQTSQGERELSIAEQEVAGCDALVQHPGRPNKSTIAPKTRREVLARDRHQCRRKGCGHTGYLHIHHLVPRVEGGSNDSENLVTLCSACHHLWHERGGDLASLLTEAIT